MRALVTLWCAVLSMAFIFACAVSVIMLMIGVTDNNGSAIGMSFLCLLGFSWGASRYFRRFAMRVEETHKNDEKFKDWDNDEED